MMARLGKQRLVDWTGLVLETADGPGTRYVAQVEGVGLSARRTLRLVAGEPRLSAYLSAPEGAWSSSETDLVVTASPSNFDQVELSVELKTSPALPEQWRVRASFYVTREDIQRFAREVQELEGLLLS